MSYIRDIICNRERVNYNNVLYYTIARGTSPATVVR